VASDYAKLAREHLERAEPHVPDGDETQAITWLHLAAEAAVEAVAEADGIDTMKMHQRKAKVAHELYEKGTFSVDLRPTLLLLNEARKSTNYGRSDVDLEGRSTEDLYSEIETAVAEAEEAT
jgi:HEPN domain-containing protein